jgi:hypothetical protein
VGTKKSTKQAKSSQNGQATSGYLSKKWWLGVGAIVSAIGVIVGIVAIAKAPGESSPRTISAKNGNCIIQGGNGNSCSAIQASPSINPTVRRLTASQQRVIDCHALATDAADESTELAILKSSISVDDPTSRVTAHTSSFGAAYARAIALMQLIIARKDRFENDGGKTRVDPRLEGDLTDMASDLPSLHAAVLSNGVGGSQWNQLSDYSHDFNLLATLRCA